MKGTLGRIWSLSSKRHKELSMALLCSFLRSSLGVTQILAIVYALQTLTGELDARSGILRIALFTIICVVGNYLISYREQTNSISSAMYTISDKRKSLAEHIRRVPLGIFRKDMSERIIATLTSTLSGLEMATSMTMIGIVSGFFNACMFLVFMCFFEWRLAIVMALGIICYLIVVRIQMTASRREAPKRQKAQTELAARALSFSRGIRVIKAFSPGKGDERLEDAIEGSRRENIALTDKSMPTQMLSHFTVAIFESILVFLTVYLVIHDPSISVSKAIVLLLMCYMAYATLNQAGSILSMIGMIESGLEEMDDVDNLPVLESRDDKTLPEKDEIVLEDVHFCYGDREVIKGVNADFKPGTLTALIGPSGAGKTTLCHLVARFHEISSGRITIGGVDIRDVSYDELMRKISFVFQDTYLFEDTIEGNIRFGKPDASDEEVREAARLACCEEFISKLPDGFDTMVEEGGKSLSGGEKQRIAIARAILKDAPIIVLDEATSALDAENEDQFFKAVENLIKNKTVIMIAHRLSSVEHADRVIALRDGSVVEEGTPEELSSKPGLYREFLDSRLESKDWTL